jgi:hypothetical protein
MSPRTATALTALAVANEVRRGVASLCGALGALELHPRRRFASRKTEQNRFFFLSFFLFPFFFFSLYLFPYFRYIFL